MLCLVNSVGLFRVLSDASGRSRCFAFWQEFSKACSSFLNRMLSQFTHTFHVKSTVLCSNGQPQRVQPASRRLLGVSASHKRGMLYMLFVDYFPFSHGVDYRLRARKPSKRSLSRRYSTKLQRVGRLQMCWQMVL